MEFGPVALAPYPYRVAKDICIYLISVFSCYARNSEECSYCPPREESAGQAESEPFFGQSDSCGLETKSLIVKDLSHVDV